MQLETVINIQQTSLLVLILFVACAAILKNEPEWFKAIGGLSIIISFIIFMATTFARIWM